MDIATGTLVDGASQGSEMGIKLLKKAQEMGENTLKLVESLPETKVSPPGMGTKIDLSA